MCARVSVCRCDFEVWRCVVSTLENIKNLFLFWRFPDFLPTPDDVVYVGFSISCFYIFYLQLVIISYN